MKKKKYLVTGGLGFIGSAIANSLKGSITVISRSSKDKNRIKNKNVKILIKDISAITKNDIEGVDCIYHCASTTHNYHVLTDTSVDVDTNIKGTLRILELCKDLTKKPKIIYPATIQVYGNEYDNTKKPITEESKIDPLGLYGITKLATEEILKLYSRLYQIPYLIARFTNVYGASETFDDPKKAWLNFAVMRAIRGENLNVYHGGNFKRDYIYIDDVIDALHFLENKAVNETYLIGYGKPVQFKDMINYILEHTGNKSKITPIPPPAFHNAVGITNFVANTSKINKLGWHAQIDYTEGLKKIINHYKRYEILRNTQ
ncbi:MAG: NAD(P)-dependent oxidoreductase [Candidatus Taylorbacteria bacterium]|nr:NAD(P)-dependent oxidoreductase [Candidatus Taylorbacteria bacterium]